MLYENQKPRSRWEDKSIDEFGKTITLFLGMSFASIGFVLNLLINKDFHFRNNLSRDLILLGLLIILICVVIFIATSINKLRHINFKWVSKNQEAWETLRYSFILFVNSMVIFGVGEIILIAGLVIQIYDKF